MSSMSSTNTNASGFYVLGGTLPRDARSYIARKADAELLENLRQGRFCYVLTSRQMGKSSLMVRAAMQLRRENVTCVVLDMTAIGQNVTPEQWYDGLLNSLAAQIGLEDELDEFWLTHPHLGPLQRWMQALKSVVLTRLPGPIVLFLDEIDAVLSLPFSTDEFFAAIRESYNRRTEDADFARLTFCLLGVATPADLIRESRSTPFNIGVRIELNDFTPAEAQPLAQGWRRKSKDEGGRRKDESSSSSSFILHPSSLLPPLNRVLYWTGGHPYLTQRLCQAVAAGMAQQAGVDNANVDRICEELFLSAGARNRDDNLLFVRERLLRSDVDRAGLLETYARIRAEGRVKDDRSNPLLNVLRLAGIVRADGEYLRVRNPIYAHVFNSHWIRANMPDAEIRRQQMAYRRGFIQAATLSGVLIALTGSLAWTAAQQAYRAHAFAVLAAGNAVAANTEAQNTRRALYAANMALAQQAWEAKNYGRERELLESCRPAAGQPDLRGFEWGLLWRRGHFDLPSLPLQSGYVYTDVAFSQDGRKLRTDDGHGGITFWDAQSGQAVPKSQERAADFAHAPRFSGPQPPSNQADVSPDGSIRAVGRHYYKEEPESKHPSVTLRDAKTGTVVHTLKGAMPAFAFSPDSKILATESNSDAVLLWDTATGRKIKTLAGGRGPLAFSPDGTRLAAGTYAYGWGLKVFDVTEEREPHSLPGTADAGVMDARGDLLATLDSDWNGVTLWNASTLRRLRTLPGATYPLAISADGKVVATGTRGNERLVALWDTATGREINRPGIKTQALDGLTFSPDGNLLAISDRQEGITLWSVAARRALKSFPHGRKTPAFSPNGTLMALEQAGGESASARTPSPQKVVLYDVKTGKPVQTLTGAQTPLAFAPDGQTLAAEGPNNTMALWEVATGQKRQVFTGHRYRIQTCAFSPDGQRLAAGDSGEYNVILWDTVSGHETFHIPGRTERTDVASYTLCFSPDGKRLFSGNQNDTFQVWEASLPAPRAGTTGQ